MKVTPIPTTTQKGKPEEDEENRGTGRSMRNRIGRNKRVDDAKGEHRPRRQDSSKEKEESVREGILARYGCVTEQKNDSLRKISRCWGNWENSFHPDRYSAALFASQNNEYRIPCLEVTMFKLNLSRQSCLLLILFIDELFQKTRREK